METADLHSRLILDEYEALLPVYQRLEQEVQKVLKDALARNGLMVTAVVTRIKTEESLLGKLALKGSKYRSLSDITDVLGARIITYYTDDVDRIAAMAEKLFDIDWENSVDKRRLHNTDSFGYNSLHYICSLPKTLVNDPTQPWLNEVRFELQLRTTLQHAWASINHDIGYKSGVEIPRNYLREINRLAGMLELADDEFSRIRTEITDYRRRVKQLVQNGNLDEVQLDGDTFQSYLQARPFDMLNRRIAAINQAEIQEVPLTPFLEEFVALGCKTLEDVDKLRRTYTDEAYALARYQLGNTDLDIISSSVGIQNICIVCILAQGGGKMGLTRMFNTINGESELSAMLAEITYNQAKNLPFMNKYDNAMQPVLINLNDYERTGEGANGASYNHKTDKDVMLKLYFRNFEAARHELEVAKKAYEAGIPTPEPGDLVTDGERLGIRFRRIDGKKSFSRACGDDPEHTEDYALEFAQLCKRLHATHVDTAKFDNVKTRLYEMLEANPFFTDEQKQKIHAFIAAAPDADTAIHGDLQFSNGIFVDKDGVRTTYLIDMGDFCYGYPMFDIGMVYLCCKLNDEAWTMEQYHMSNAVAARFWDAFAREYFGPEANLEEIEKEVKIYAGLKTLIVERDTHRPMPEFRAMLEGTVY